MERRESRRGASQGALGPEGLVLAPSPSGPGPKEPGPKGPGLKGPQKYCASQQPTKEPGPRTCSIVSYLTKWHLILAHILFLIPGGAKITTVLELPSCVYSPVPPVSKLARERPQIRLYKNGRFFRTLKTAMLHINIEVGGTGGEQCERPYMFRRSLFSHDPDPLDYIDLPRSNRCGHQN